jgi:hypothetical protein
MPTALTCNPRGWTQLLCSINCDAHVVFFDDARAPFVRRDLQYQCLFRIKMTLPWHTAQLGQITANREGNQWGRKGLRVARTSKLREYCDNSRRRMTQASSIYRP